MDMKIAQMQKKSRILSDSFLFNTSYQHIPITQNDLSFFNKNLNV